MIKAWAPILLLGVPLEESENPLLSIPGYRASLKVDVWECDNPSVEIRGPQAEKIRSLVSGFNERFSEASGTPLCSRVEYGVEGAVSPASLYALVTAILAYRVARMHGETLDSWEIVEAARYADPFEPPSGWGYVMDSLRYTVATGKVAVYRNDEEFAAMADPVRHKLRYATSVSAPRQWATRSLLGADPYNALVHLVGVSVLEAAVRTREESSVEGVLAGIAPLLSNIISYAWRLPAPEPGCLYSPGLPGVFDVYCVAEGARHAEGV